MVHLYCPDHSLPKTEAEWLSARKSGIGASEASAIIGCSPYMSNIDLWKIKTGRKDPPDISQNDVVKYGHEAEGPLRELFAINNPQYHVSYGGAFDMVWHPKYPFLFATLDGRLEEVETGQFGVLEIKTANILQRAQKAKWYERIPQNYYVQVLHQLLVTGWEFAVLSAQLKQTFVDDARSEIRQYRIDRSDVQQDLEYLLQEELKFWQYVQDDQEPPMILPYF